MQVRRIVIALALSVVAVAGFAEGPPTNVIVTSNVMPDSFSPGRNYPDAITITVKEPNGTPVKATKVHAIANNDAKLYLTDKGQLTQDLELTTNDEGKATFSLVVGKSTDFAILYVPQAGTTPLLTHTATDRISTAAEFGDPVMSKRGYLQLFLGQTFTNNYDKDGKSTGFGNAGQLVRLTFNTMWRHQSKKLAPADDHAFGHGLWHTDALLEFSKFPFGANAAQTENENKKGLQDAFSGGLGLTWEPNRWATYVTRSDQEKLQSDPNFDFDVYRWGLFGRGGLTTRAKAETTNGNTSINRIQFGVRFTETHSPFSDPVHEERNSIPIRFVEISWGRFSEFADVKHANRLVLDGGLRVPGFGNDTIPFYVGMHINSGRGPDDLRVFLGFLMKLDRLGAIVRGANPAS